MFQSRFYVCLLVGGLSLFGGCSPASAYPIFAQQGYENPREATGRIVCANCHLAQRPVDISVPQAVFPDSVFEAVVKIPYDPQLKQVIGNGKKGGINVGAVLILPDGFTLAPPERLSAELKERVGKLYFSPYSDERQNILVVGPVPGKTVPARGLSFPILAPDPRENKSVAYLKYPIYLGGNRGRGQIYPDGKKSNNTFTSSPIAGEITAIEKGADGATQVSILAEGSSEPTLQSIPAGPELIVSQGQRVLADQPLTNDPNVGGFGQGETEIVLQNPLRIQGLLLFLVFVLCAQVILVLKKKQFEKVQLAEMRF